MQAFLKGLWEMVPSDILAVFSPRELELLISGLPTINVDGMRAHAYTRDTQKTHLSSGAHLCTCIRVTGSLPSQGTAWSCLFVFGSVFFMGTGE